MKITVTLICNHQSLYFSQILSSMVKKSGRLSIYIANLQQIDVEHPVKRF
ncbi:hypothetical protein SAMN05192573_10922 [Mucilaginibacter gossypii]|uniref:Uncharacterized protein n=1 Tax=Mucilaginibacter gossypii TaxID=551996 RepID=A0A1G8BQI4_9SPHI|nr:hypothetical protein SAMN05192573_10922 [Mucilaginibacter gossypii]